jgi:general secretion pathway protein J
MNDLTLLPLSGSFKQCDAQKKLNGAHKTEAGFTLLEVLIAIGITAMIGLGSWQILNSAIRTNELTQTKLEELKALQKTMLIISRDLQQVVARSIRDEYGDYQPALQTKGSLYKLELSRSGWRNPLGDPRSSVQRVAYELNQEEFVRHYWNVLDRSQDSESVYRTLLKGVEEFSIRFMKDDLSWTSEWPIAEASSEESSDPLLNKNQIPKAVKITFKLKPFGTVSRVYDLVSYLPNKALKDTNADENAGDDITSKEDE